MNRALIESHLALAERHVADSRERLLPQQKIIAQLESSGRSRSLTATMARDLLQLFRAELAMHIADRNRLRQWIARGDDRHLADCQAAEPEAPANNHHEKGPAA